MTSSTTPDEAVEREALMRAEIKALCDLVSEHTRARVASSERIATLEAALTLIRDRGGAWAQEARTALEAAKQ